MARRRFFVDAVNNGHAQIVGEEAHHLTRVLRVEPGQKFEISDNQNVYLAEVESARKDLVSFAIVERIEAAAPVVRTILLASLIKFDRFELMLSTWQWQHRRPHGRDGISRHEGGTALSHRQTVRRGNLPNRLEESPRWWNDAAGQKRIERCKIEFSIHTKRDQGRKIARKIGKAIVLGKKCLAMLPWKAEWRYGKAGSQMIWYSSIELFRQVEEGNWSDVLGAIDARLSAEVSRAREGLP